MEVDDTAVPVEEAPAEAPPAISSSSSSSNAQGSVSSEYLEAFQGIQSDPYDTTSWNILLEEVEKGNGGTASVVETFSRFLKQFPRAARVYGRLAEHHVKTNNAAAAEELLCKEVGKLRHVDLWMQYLKIMKRQVSGDRGGTATAKDKADQQHLARRAYESAFDRALDNVGYSIESGPIWKDYIDFLRDYPEAQMDPAKKMAAIRKAYQRALCVPMDNLDTLWRDYEGYERMLSEHAAKEILPDVQNKYLSAKALYRERKRMVGRIFFDRQAVPSSRSRQELEQLDLWNKWIRYEKGNPDNLSSENLKGAMQMVYEQCLCCMRFHPEVWLSLAKFKMGVGQAGSIEEARAVFDEAIETLPNVAFLRIAYSEVEEHHGSMDKARDILDAAFGHLPSGLTFSVLQRFTRRRDGIVAARKFFSDTLPMRIDKKLGYEVRNAQLMYSRSIFLHFEAFHHHLQSINQSINRTHLDFAGLHLARTARARRQLPARGCSQGAGAGSRRLPDRDMHGAVRAAAGACAPAAGRSQQDSLGLSDGSGRGGGGSGDERGCGGDWGQGRRCGRGKRSGHFGKCSGITAVDAGAARAMGGLSDGRDHPGTQQRAPSRRAARLPRWLPGRL